MPSSRRHRMAPQVHARRLTLILPLLLASVATTARAGDPSPRRQAELDQVVARRRAERQKRAMRASIEATASAQLAREVREYEVAMTRNLAAYQMAVASTSRSSWTSQCRPRQDDSGSCD